MGPSPSDPNMLMMWVWSDTTPGGGSRTRRSDGLRHRAEPAAGLPDVHRRTRRSVTRPRRMSSAASPPSHVTGSTAVLCRATTGPARGVDRVATRATQARASPAPMPSRSTAASADDRGSRSIGSPRSVRTVCPAARSPGSPRMIAAPGIGQGVVQQASWARDRTAATVASLPPVGRRAGRRPQWSDGPVASR